MILSLFGQARASEIQARPASSDEVSEQIQARAQGLGLVRARTPIRGRLPLERLAPIQRYFDMAAQMTVSWRGKSNDVLVLDPAKEQGLDGSTGLRGTPSVTCRSKYAHDPSLLEQIHQILSFG